MDNTKPMSRFYEKDGYWYFKTKSQHSIGPYDCLKDAQNGFLEFLQFSEAEPEAFMRAFGIKAD